MSRRGKFITFEGLDGTGKSTQMRKLAAVVRASGHKVVETREPGGTLTGEKIRKVLLDSGTAGLSPLAEMALMFASRAQHIARSEGRRDARARWDTDGRKDPQGVTRFGDGRAFSAGRDGADVCFASATHRRSD